MPTRQFELESGQADLTRYSCSEHGTRSFCAHCGSSLFCEFEQLRALGLWVEIGRHALNDMGFVSDTPENRAVDLQEFFANPQVRAIVAAIGGNQACHLLPLLDYSLIRQNPKAFVGYSDNTVLNVAFWTQAGLVTFDGPTLLTDFGEPPAMFEYSRTWFQRALCEPGPIGALQPARQWTEAKADWELPDDQARPRPMLESPGWTFLKPGVAEGVLLGGCLESLQHLRGTRFWPDWTDAILLLETSEERPTPAAVDAMLMDYERPGEAARDARRPADALHRRGEGRAQVRPAGPNLAVRLSDRLRHGLRPHGSAAHLAHRLRRPDRCGQGGGRGTRTVHGRVIPAHGRRLTGRSARESSRCCWKPI